MVNGRADSPRRVGGRLALTHLTFIGADVPDATVSFGPGTTVVRGPSLP
jgi:hypothetical protein